MQRDARSFLWDVRERADAVAEFLRGRTLDDYISNFMLRSAVERQFTIIGEALSQLATVAPEIAARIPELPQAVAFRNILIHGYEQVIDATVGVRRGRTCRHCERVWRRCWRNSAARH